MKRQHGSNAAVRLFACLLACGVLTGCAGPSTRVLPQNAAGDRPHEVPKENQVLEEVNPFYLQESLDYLSGFLRESGSPGEYEAGEYIRQLLTDYGYEVQTQSFSAGDPAGKTMLRGTNVAGSRKAQSSDGDILIIAANHDSLPGSPGANNGASGAAALLECARLLSRLPTDTELRFVSFAGSRSGNAGAGYYVDSLSGREQNRVIGVILLDALGYAADSRVVLGTIDGEQTLIGNLLETESLDVTGLTYDWQYVLQENGNHVSFSKREIPTVVVRQSREAYENGTPQDRADTVNVELLAGVVDIVSRTAAWLMDADTPSQLAKSRSMNRMQDGAWIQRRDVRFPFGAGYEQVDEQLGTVGALVSSNTDGAGIQVDTYQYRMKWFDVDQIILTNYYYSEGKLETISLDADGAGVEFEEMKERIASWYGEPVGENSGPNGTEYNWTDSLYHKFIALIPASNGFEVEIQDYTPDPKQIGTFLPDGTAIEQTVSDTRTEKLLKLFRDIVPAEHYDRLSGIAVYTDGVGDNTGYLELPGADADTEQAGAETAAGTHQTVLWIDVEDALTEAGAWRNQTDTIRMLVKCYGQLLELYGEERYTAGYRVRFGPEADVQEDGARASEPDFSEDFMRFVLFQKPVGTRDISDGRIGFFYEYEEFISIRTRIRSNLQLIDDTPTANLPVESGTVSPEP